MSESEVVVRACREEDIPVLAGMMRDIWYDTAGYRKVEEWFGVKVGGKHWWEHKADSLKEIFHRNPERVVVAEVGGEVIGYATFRVEGDVGWVGENGVHPAFRGKGAGKKLHGEVLRKLKEAGVKIAFVITTMENAAARKVYESHGFRTIHTSVLLVNKLGEGR